MAKKKWAGKVKLDEGSLKALGYPSLSKLKAAVTNGKVSYKKLIQKLLFIANAGNNATARRLIAALKAWRARSKK